jgi:hypothetical protein
MAPALRCPASLLVLLLLVVVARGGPSRIATVYNFNDNLSYSDELVRLQVDLRGQNASQVAVSCAGAPVWSQVELLTGAWDAIETAHLWVATTLASGENATYVVEFVAAPPVPPGPPAVTASCAGQVCVLASNLVRVEVAANSSGPASNPSPPLLGVARLTPPVSNGLLGRSSWAPLPADVRFSGFTSTLTAAGPLFAEALLEYTFNSTTTGAVSVASWRVRLAPNRLGPLITEKHNVSIDAGVELLMRGSSWAPNLHAGEPWFYCNRSLSIDPNGTMIEDQTPVIEPLEPEGRLPNNTFGYLQPRWSQSCDSRWYWGVSDNSAAPQALVVLTGRPHLWEWPQWTGSDFQTMRAHTMAPYTERAPDNSSWQAAVHLPLLGARWWYWLVPTAEALLDPTGSAMANLSVAYTMQELDRLNNEYVLEWPGAFGWKRGELRHLCPLHNPERFPNTEQGSLTTKLEASWARGFTSKTRTRLTQLCDTRVRSWPFESCCLL